MQMCSGFSLKLKRPVIFPHEKYYRVLTKWTWGRLELPSFLSKLKDQDALLFFFKKQSVVLKNLSHIVILPCGYFFMERMKTYDYMRIHIGRTINIREFLNCPLNFKTSDYE